MKPFHQFDEFEVTCIRKEAASSGRDRITQIGIRLGDEHILVDVSDAAALIRMGKAFFVDQAGERTLLRAMQGANGKFYVETRGDATLLNNLASLPTCSDIEKNDKEDPKKETDSIEHPAEISGKMTGKLSRPGWIWLLCTCLLLAIMGVATVLAHDSILDLPSTSLFSVAGLSALLMLANGLAFRPAAREVYETHFKQRQRGWLALTIFFLIFILLLIILNPKAPVISFAPLSDRTFLDPDFSVSASTGDNEPIRYITSPERFCSLTEAGLIHINNAGSCAVTAFSPSNPRVIPVTRTFTINRKPQAIIFEKVPEQVYGDPDLTLSASADSHMPVSFSASGSCESQGDSAHILNAGNCTIIAHQNGNENYLPAEDVKHQTTIGKKSQAIRFIGPADQSLDQPFVPINATVNSGLQVIYATADQSICTMRGNMVILHKPGDCAITASQPGNENFQAAQPVVQIFKILPQTKNDQTITFDPLEPMVFGSPDFTLNASASSGLAVSFTASGKCRVIGQSVKITGAGACMITAHQDGNDRFDPARPVSQNLTIARATPVIFWGNPDEILVGTPLGSGQLYATAQAVAWNPANPYTGVPGTYRYTPDVGTVLPVGIHRLSVVFTPFNTDDYNSSQMTVSIIVVPEHTEE